MHLKLLKTQTVNHRDGTKTNWAKFRVSTEDVILQAAIRLHLLPERKEFLPSHIRWGVTNEEHGMRTYTRIRITDIGADITSEMTKTQLARLIGLGISTIDPTNTILWDNDQNSGGNSIFYRTAFPKTVRQVLWELVDGMKDGEVRQVTEEQTRLLHDAATMTYEMDIANAIEQKSGIALWESIVRCLDTNEEGPLDKALVGHCFRLVFFTEA